jgi:RHS repeat-associated protein
MTYDQTGRHISTTAATAKVVYTRDVTDDIVVMATTTGGVTTTVNYTGGGGIAFTINAATNACQEEDLTLAGGVTVSLQGTTTQVWSYPDLHGDDTIATNQTGVRQGAVALYDPFGDPIDLATGLIGTLTANGAVPGNTTTAGASFGWEGAHGKQYQHAGDIATIEMGDRQYVPLLGRFLSTDPIPGGNSNDYNYPNDPVNGQDLSGNCSWDPNCGMNWAAANPQPSAADIKQQAEIDKLTEESWAMPHPAWLEWMIPIAKFQYQHQDAINATVGLVAVGASSVDYSAEGVSVRSIVKPVVRWGPVTPGEPNRVSLGPALKYWGRMSGAGKAIFPFHIHIESAKVGIEFHPMGWSKWWKRAK